MNTRLINKTNNVFDLFDQAFFNEDYSFWRRPSNFTSTSSLSWGDSGDAYDLHIPLPGFKKEHIKAEIDDGVMSVLAKREDDSASYSFNLPEAVDVSKLSAKMEDGLLSLRAEKLEKSKRIQLEIS
tara:strand:+ start:542 stop:919 length:378 start_codon:yes stop_codon:yes gene_type:complete